MAGKIFVNYRRDDERAMAARVRDRLAQAFGAANVFMDVDNLLAGQRFDKELEKALAETEVFLAIIGPKWLSLLLERRGSVERDFVRYEIAAALKRGVTAIPVLVEGARLPRSEELPEDIRALVLHQKHDVSHERFGRDVDALVSDIRAVPSSDKGRTDVRGGSWLSGWVRVGSLLGAVLSLPCAIGVYLHVLSERKAEWQVNFDKEFKPCQTAMKAKPREPGGGLFDDLLKTYAGPESCAGKAQQFADTKHSQTWTLFLAATLALLTAALVTACTALVTRGLIGIARWIRAGFGA